MPLSALGASDPSWSYQTYEVVDDLILPEGYTYDLITA